MPALGQVVAPPVPALPAFSLPTPLAAFPTATPSRVTPASSSANLLSRLPISSPTPAPGVTTVPVGGNPDDAEPGAVVMYDQGVAAAAMPTVQGLRLQKRQTVVQVVVVTVVTLVAQTPQPTPTVVTLTVPPPQNTVIAQGGWPIINPGSAAACWGDYACNSVCPNFQQNGWYSGCIDAACTQCRCQIIEPSMCNGLSYTNSSYYVNQAPQTVTVYAPYGSPYYGNTAGVVTVWVAGAAGAFGGLKSFFRTAGVAIGAWWLLKLV